MRNLIAEHRESAKDGTLQTMILINKRNQKALKRDLPALMKAVRLLVSEGGNLVDAIQACRAALGLAEER